VAVIGFLASAVVSGILLAVVTALAGDVDDLVVLGERWWTRSPDSRDPVACATCHHDTALTRAWAGGFPKWKPAPPPHARVMTLLQANAEAVRLHYGLVRPEHVATAITAYLAAQARGTAITPGRSVGQPAFPERLRALAASSQRGHRLFEARCSRCHQATKIAPIVIGFPRLRHGTVESVEAFIERHAASTALSWNSSAMADLVAYLTGHMAGRLLGGPGQRDN
jgi:mono/diheme cytochrome c family protein